MSPAKKKSAAKKSAETKSSSKRTASKKTAARRKTVVKKDTVKRPVTKKKTSVKKAAVKKSPVSKTPVDMDEVSRIGAKNLEAVAMDIDRQMKMLAEIDTRVIGAKEQLADFQEMVQAKINSFKERKSDKPAGSHKALMTSIRETRDEALKIIKDSKAINATYKSTVTHLEEGRVAAMKEAKKAEIALVNKFHEVEAKILKKAGEIRKNLKK